MTSERSAEGAGATSDLRIALVQMRCEKGTVDRNLATMADYLAAACDADVVCFPEMSITGYVEPARHPRAVLRLDGPEVARFVALTRGSPATALAGLVEAHGAARPYITQVVARGGELLGYYRKRTIVDDEARWFSPGEGAPPVFAHRGVPFGLAICADIDDPEVFAAGTRRGARVIFEAAAPGLYGAQATRDWRAGFEWWRGECRAKLGRYARDLGVYIAVATQAGRTVDEDFPGGGYLFGPDGACLAATPDWAEGVLEATVPVGAGPEAGG